MVALLLGGVGNFVAPHGVVAHDVLPLLMVRAWGLIMAFAGALALIAAFWHDRVSGLLLERIALSGAALSTLVYGITLWSFGAVGVGLSLAFSLCGASLWRITHVNRELRILREWISRHYS